VESDPPLKHTAHWTGIGWLKICLMLGLTMVAAGGSAAELPDLGLAETDLCPPVPDSRRVVVSNKVTTVPPATDEETVSARERLRSADAAARHNAVVALALAGDIPTFDFLLAERDLNGLSVYAYHYVNAEGHACLAPEIENAILVHFDDPELRPYLLSFFTKNLYRQPEIFDLLVQYDFDDSRPDDFPRTMKALTSTRLQGVEDEVFQKAEANLVHDTPVRKRVLPAAHRVFVTFLADRAYQPAIGYMEDLLQAEGYDEELDSFVAEYSVPRSTIYRALDGFPSPLVADVYTRQLNRVASGCPARLVNYELAAFGSRAVRHAVTDDQRRRIAESLAILLGVGPETATERGAPAGATDPQIHKACVELLAELGTTEAAAVLLGDLERVIRDADDGFQPSFMLASTRGGARAAAEFRGAGRAPPPRGHAGYRRGPSAVRGARDPRGPSRSGRPRVLPRPAGVDRGSTGGLPAAGGGRPSAGAERHHRPPARL